MPMTTTTKRRWLLGAAGAVFLAGAGLTVFRYGGPWRNEAHGPDADLPASGPQDLAYAELELQLRRRPRDARAWVLKARADMAAGRHELAAQAYAQAVKVGPKVAKDATVWVEYAEAQGLAQGGTLTGEPRALLERALTVNPLHPQALDLAGSAAWEANDFDAAARYWQRLQQQLPADDPRQQALKTAVDTAQRRVRLSLPAPAPAASRQP
jgi:cytochrome c-type biogenesis protein CcmH/NrfG